MIDKYNIYIYIYIYISICHKCNFSLFAVIVVIKGCVGIIYISISINVCVYRCEQVWGAQTTLIEISTEINLGLDRSTKKKNGISKKKVKINQKNTIASKPNFFL